MPNIRRLVPPLPIEIPKALPRNLLPELLRQRKMLLCLDYDGTLSEITARPSEAHPVPSVRKRVAALSAYRDRIEIAIVSGRDIDTVRHLLGLASGLFFVGEHGLETADLAGKREVVPGVEAAADDLAKVRKWIDNEVSARTGFIVEYKRSSIALHYRSANPTAATAVRNALQTFLDRECSRVETIDGKMVEEVIPRGVGGKGSAVRRLLDSMAESKPLAVYFGDDTTDEDAFFALRGLGITVRVGAPQRSWAQYRISSPNNVAGVLGDLLAVLEPAHKLE
jgi:trehalose 6-phosphate phosphatase